jgi:nucleoside-diphosphate-sugar epimerase
MKVLVIGAHGNIGQKVVQLLVDSGNQVVAGVRKQTQFDDFNDKVQPIQFDLEALPNQLASLMVGIDAIIFTAGSGGKTGADKTMLVDLDGAVKSMQAAEIAGVKRFIIVSALYTDDRSKWQGDMRPYYAAKYYADQWLINQTNLDYTIIRPGRLTDDDATGNILLTVDKDVAGAISRQDVAQTVVDSLSAPQTKQKIFNIINGDTKINSAISEL